MYLLVTGSTGFIGSQLCRALVRQGHRVRAFHRPSSSLRMIEDLELEHAIGDLTQPETLVEAMQGGVEAVFHAAAFMGEARDPGRRYAVTVEGTRAVLQAAQQAGVHRVVHTSSVAALGVPESGPALKKGQAPAAIDESHTWNYAPGRWRYGYAKYLAEMEVQKAVAQGLDVVIVNPTVVIGAGDVYRTSRSLVVQVAQGHVPVAAPGGLNVVHVADVIAGHLAALERGRSGERYILGGQNLSVPALLRVIANVVGAHPPRGVLPVGVARTLGWATRVAGSFLELPVGGETLGMAGRYFYYDTSKARRELGLGEPHSVRQAVEDAWAWFRQQGAA